MDGTNWLSVGVQDKIEVGLKKFYSADRKELKEMGATDLWFRAAVQPIPGPGQKVEITLSIAPADHDHVNQLVAGHNTTGFPVFKVGQGHLPMLPQEDLILIPLLRFGSS